MSEQWLRPCLWTQLVNRSRICCSHQYVNYYCASRTAILFPFFLFFLTLIVLFDSNKQDLKVFYTNWNEINMTFFFSFSFIFYLIFFFHFKYHSHPPLLLPYHPKCTRSLLILEIKQGWAWLNLDGRPPFLVGRWSGSPHLTFPFLVAVILTLQSWLLALLPAADINLSICVISEKLGLPKNIF